MEIKAAPDFGPYYVADKWCLDRYMHTDEVQNSLCRPDQFYIRDTTLREGEETPGLSMTLQDKVKIAEKLAEAGIQQIDIGYVGPNQSHYDAAQLIKQEIPELAITGFARVWASDWKRDVDRCLEVGASQIDVLQHPILIWASDALVEELGPPREALIPRTIEIIEYIKSCGGRAAYGHPDCTRTPWEILESFYSAAAQAGADMIILYEDGYGCPPGVEHLVRKVRGLLDVPLMIHCHDDLGLGTANTLAAVGAGAVAADGVVNGLGDKGGLAKLEEVVVGLETHYGVSTGVRLEKLTGLSRYVEEITGFTRQFNKPLVGDNAYIHETELHVYCILKGLWEAMEGVHPELIGQERHCVFGSTTLHGGAARARLDALGLRHSAQDVETILDGIRKRLTTQDGLTMDEFDALAREVLGANQ
jgi:2-isopropylmalate synthase